MYVLEAKSVWRKKNEKLEENGRKFKCTEEMKVKKDGKIRLNTSKIVLEI